MQSVIQPHLPIPGWFLTFDQEGNAHRAAWMPLKWSEDETGAIYDHSRLMEMHR